MTPRGRARSVPSLSSGAACGPSAPVYGGHVVCAQPLPFSTPEPEPKPVLTSAQILSGKGNMSSDLVLFNADVPGR